MTLERKGPVKPTTIEIMDDVGERELLEETLAIRNRHFTDEEVVFYEDQVRQATIRLSSISLVNITPETAEKLKVDRDFLQRMSARIAKSIEHNEEVKQPMSPTTN